MKQKILFLFLFLCIIACKQEEEKHINFTDRLEPLNRIINLMDQGWTVWGCAPIYDDHDSVHVFFCRWRNDGDWSKVDWMNSGQIVHAVSDSPLGPYTVKEVVLKARGNDHWDGSGIINPKIFKIDGKYVLLYAGTKQGRKEFERIGMAVSTSLYGPWNLISDDKPLLDVSSRKTDWDSYFCSNPSLVKTPEDKYYLFYKSRDNFNDTSKSRKIGLAIADNLEGPYVKYEKNPILNHSPKNYEDPHVWIEDGKFKMLMHDMNYYEHGAGLYLESKDGINWSDPVKGYPSTLKTFGVKQRLETPLLLMKNGKPEYLFNNRGGSEDEKVFSGFVWKIK